ncbi:unnamed protein product, partial [Taenia asiatica]|uniref:Uncharacterized protein n=1 Tax=Taenia asiatica TaxID=60517 RepID=A0A0R3VZY4_TAEAS
MELSWTALFVSSHGVGIWSSQQNGTEENRTEQNWRLHRAELAFHWAWEEEEEEEEWGAGMTVPPTSSHRKS